MSTLKRKAASSNGVSKKSNSQDNLSNDNENDSNIQKSYRPAGKLAKIRAQVPEGLTISRKDLRKEMRQMKKIRRHAYHSKNEAMPTLVSKLTDKHKQIVAKQETAKLLKEKQEKQRKKNAAKRLAREERKKAYEKAERLRIEKEEEDRRIRYEEDREIKQLEKQLHMNKRKSKLLPQKFIDEGLDYILDAIDPTKVNESMDKDKDRGVWVNDEESGEEYEESGSDEEEQSGSDEEEQSGSDEEEQSGSDEQEVDTDGEMGSDEERDMSEEDAPSEEDEQEEIEFEGESGDYKVEPEGEELGGDGAMEGFGDSDDGSSMKTESSEAADSRSGALDEEQPKEDIYGRLRDSEGNVITGQTYVPPARRRELLDDSKEGARRERLVRLKKQLKGQLNRMSDSNMLSITNQLESMYRDQSRADMNTSLKELAAEMVLGDILTPERLAMELAMLIAILHNNIGTEIGATFLEMLADTFNNLHTHTSSNEGSKKLNNVTSFLCHLYSFQITHPVLITDIIYQLIETFTDTDIEIILLMLKSVGFTLRKDVPVVLKDIILRTQQKANEADLDTYKDKSRVKFMLEVVLAIKNNNMRKIPNYDTTHMDQLKKLMKGFIKAGNMSGGRLRITYKELLEAKEKGKWWVVGSAWQGSDISYQQKSTQVSQTMTKLTTFSDKLLELARKQRMNTETRRGVFCTIMAAEDFVDAFEKLLKMELKNKQERDIITVILECCANESQYNAYYTHLMAKFISYHRRFLFTFQTCMWDRFSIMSTLSESCLRNLALLCAQLIVDQAVPIAILKKIEFGDLDKARVRFLKTLLQTIFNADKKTIMEIFYKVGAAGKNLKHLKEGLELYMHHFMLRKCKEDAKAKLVQCVSAAENGLNLNKDGVMF